MKQFVITIHPQRIIPAKRPYLLKAVTDSGVETGRFVKN